MPVSSSPTSTPHRLQRSGRAARQRQRYGRGADRLRHRSRQGRPVQPCARARPSGNGLAAQCTARIGWLNRMTQFKEKSGKNREGASVGLFAYPVLQARRRPALPGDPRPGRRGPEAACRADPRHRDQVQHRLWRRPVPPARAAYRRDRGRIMSLRDGTAKMSKSDPSDMSRINLNDADDRSRRRSARRRPTPSRCRVAGADSRAVPRPPTWSPSLPR